MALSLPKTPRIGILGGGQLGAMLVRHAIDFGFEVSVLDADATAPCARYVHHFTQASPLNYDAVVAFGTGLDVLTVEMEAVDADALRAVRDAGVAVYPSPELLETIQDKGLQKAFLEKHGYPVASGRLVDSRAELQQQDLQFPVVLKRRRGGYDGQGVMVLRSAADLERAFDAPSVLEEVVPIAQEIAVIVARNPSGETACYDPVGMVFHPERFVLEYQVSPVPGLTEALAAEAAALATRIATDIDLVGLLAVELFLTTDGRLVVNELAPRPHNSGHHTMEGCVTSQFEQHLRAVTGLPLGDPATLRPSVMLNYLEPGGDVPDANDTALAALLATPGVHLHWYGKSTGRKGRKMGHVTLTDATLDGVLKKAETVRALLPTL